MIDETATIGEKSLVIKEEFMIRVIAFSNSGKRAKIEEPSLTK
jgi:hypothetical protein